MTMLTRRACLAGAGALLFPIPGHAATAERRFRIIRAGDEIGEKVTRVVRNGSALRVDVQIDIRVRILGLTAYRYEMTLREDWEDGRLIAMRARTDDDGTADFVDAGISDGRLMITGSGYSGPAPEGAATTTYWNPVFLERPVWISTQTGRPLNVRITDEGGGRRRVSGDLDLMLIYDERMEWVGSEFDSRGETVRFQVAAQTGALASLWTGA